MIGDAARWLLFSLSSLAGRSEDEDGQTLAEYGMVISVVAVAAITIAGITFREVIVSAWNDTSSCLSDLANC
jgi:Flp pilus assembly pilin Flp